jgi:hypothetical protein
MTLPTRDPVWRDHRPEAALVYLKLPEVSKTNIGLISGVANRRFGVGGSPSLPK